MKIKPFIRIKTSAGRVLTNIITNFRYKFSEEEDELCTFTIESDDPLLPDDPELQEGKRLEVQWGWIDGPQSESRIVFIFDIDPDFGEEGLVMNFTCHEKFVIAKMDSVANKNSKQLKNTPVLFSSEVLENVSLEIEKGNPELKALLTNNDVSLDINSAYTQTPQGDKVVSYYNGNYSTFKNLRAFLDKLPGGPYVIDSRDEGVIIRTRDFKQSSLLTYYYNKSKGNPLLKFKPETKNRSNKGGSEQIDVTSWDKKKKTAITQSSSITDKGQVKLSNSTTLDLSKIKTAIGNDSKDIPDVIKKANADYNKTGKTVKEMGGLPVNPPSKNPKKPSVLSSIIGANGQQATNAGKDLSKFENKTVLTKGKLPTGQEIKKLYIGYDYGKVPAIRGVTVAKDNVAVAKPIYDIVVEEAKPKKNIISPESARRAKALADNERKNNELKNNPATARMEGEPLLQSGKIITILGIAIKYAGNYYIRDCEHVIDDQGYITECTKMSRQGVNKTKTSANIPSTTLPSSQYFYDLNKPENYKWDEGNVINVSKGNENPVAQPQTKTIEIKKAQTS